MAREAQETLWHALRLIPREDSVSLPSGDVVEGFAKLEVDGAGVRNAAGVWMPIELHLPVPPPGVVTLPGELDEETAPMASCGVFLRGPEVASLAQEADAAGDGCECAICFGGLAQPSLAEEEDAAAIAAEDVRGRVFRLSCGHSYHATCLQRWFAQRQRCPRCQRAYGKVVGSQPRVGTLAWRSEGFGLPGCRASETLIVEFAFSPGVDEGGQHYEGRKPKCYLPGNCQGILLLELFKVAFRRRVMFGLGASMSFGTYRPTFNIHIKTSSRRGGAEHGFPDSSYFERSIEELRTNGVTLADLPWD